MTLFIGSAFQLEDLDVLRNALDAWCQEKRVDISSSQAHLAASAALDLYQSGHNDAGKLLTALRDHKAL
ncbi:hypothetical protein QTL95_14360 [Rhizobium sp. S152]|uniref:hypothetical protein n=1 Tax=Rhizobium sp. S152 TaxID=3055038 RepID=UPI0025A96338|nr:hypothetical protein [Rhizobium sp. S152]MDM9627087.1 hypothetical protein [Rhizobium sp. S152]